MQIDDQHEPRPAPAARARSRRRRARSGQRVRARASPCLAREGARARYHTAPWVEYIAPLLPRVRCSRSLGRRRLSSHGCASVHRLESWAPVSVGACTTCAVQCVRHRRRTTPPQQRQRGEERRGLRSNGGQRSGSASSSSADRSSTTSASPKSIGASFWKTDSCYWTAS